LNGQAARREGHEKEIDPKATYTIVTIDYLVNVGAKDMDLAGGKEHEPSALTLRDALWIM